MCSSDSGLLGNALRRIVRAATHPARRDRDGRVVVLFRFVAEFGLWNVALFALCPRLGALRYAKTKRHYMWTQQ